MPRPLPPLLLLLIRVVLVILTLEISMKLISSFWCYHLQLFLLVNFLCCDTVSVSQFARTVVDEREKESLPACLQIRRLVCRLCNSGAAFIDIVFLFSSFSGFHDSLSLSLLSVDCVSVASVSVLYWFSAAVPPRPLCRTPNCCNKGGRPFN